MIALLHLVDTIIFLRAEDCFLIFLRRILNLGFNRKEGLVVSIIDRIVGFGIQNAILGDRIGSALGKLVATTKPRATN